MMRRSGMHKLAGQLLGSTSKDVVKYAAMLLANCCALGASPLSTCHIPARAFFDPRYVLRFVLTAAVML
jgi:hypothetical protein